MISRRLIAMAVGLAVALCGCGQQMHSPTLLSSPAQTHTLVLQVNRNLSRNVLVCVDEFADAVEQMSGGALTVDVQLGYPNDTTVSREEADMVLLNNAQIARADRLFAMFSLPFLFDNGRHMTSALNSEEVRQILEQRLSEKGIFPMVAFYNGSSHLVTGGQELRTATDFRGVTAAMSVGSADESAVFQALGVRVLPYTSALRLGERVELSTEDGKSESVSVSAIEVTLDQVLSLEHSSGRVRFINSYHRMEPLWLFMSSQSFGQLTSWEQAVLLESCAGLTAGMEERRSVREAGLREQIRAREIPEVDVERLAIAGVLYGKNGQGTDLYTPPDYFDPRVYQLVQRFE